MSSNDLGPPLARADPAWLSQNVEAALEPDLPIVDPHFHLLSPPRTPYDAAAYAADLNGGHNVVATVFMDCFEAYRQDGPEAFRPVGETEFAAAVGARSAAGALGHRGVCSAIVSYVDLALGAKQTRAVLEAHIAAGGGRFRGIRYASAFDPRGAVRSSMRARRPGMLAEPAARAALGELAPMKLSLDLWLYHPQLAEAAEIAAAFPETQFILDHVGGLIGIGEYAAQRAEIFAQWRSAIREAVKRPNLSVKLGGLGMAMCGFDFHEGAAPPASEALAQAWRPYIETCIEAFGPARAMFESNFPVDKLTCSYVTLWNAFKRIAAGYSPAEKADLFTGAAARAYRLGNVLPER